jgi:hypothetical protein
MEENKNHQNKEIAKVKIPRDETPLFFWRADEFEKKEKNPRLFLILYLIVFGLIVFALFTDNIFMAIIFILFAVIFYFFNNKKPEVYTFGITSDGVFAQDHIYEFSSLENFWIFFNPEGKKELSLKSKKFFMPYISIPLGSADPVEIRKILINFLPEKEHNRGLGDILNDIF